MTTNQWSVQTRSMTRGTVNSASTSSEASDSGSQKGSDSGDTMPLVVGHNKAAKAFYITLKGGT